MKNEKAVALLIEIEAVYGELYKIIDCSLANYFLAVDYQTVRKFLNSIQGAKFKKAIVATMVTKKVNHYRDNRQVDDLLVLAFDSEEHALEVFDMTKPIFAFLKDQFSVAIKAMRVKGALKEIIFKF